MFLNALCPQRKENELFPKLNKGSLNKLNKPGFALVHTSSITVLSSSETGSLETGSFESRNWRLTVTIMKPVLKQNKTKTCLSWSIVIKPQHHLFSATEDALTGLRWLCRISPGYLTLLSIFPVARFPFYQSLHP